MPKSTFTTNRSMAATYELRARSVAGGMRRAHGQAASLVFKKRAQLLEETIYRRPALKNAKNRVLTGNLKRSESLAIAGNAFIVTNTAPYANRRHRMTGTSKLFGHDLRSFWAGRAMQETSSQRMAILRAALRETWRKNAG